ncbi:MAG TPA: class I SAM-dependent methyltransferase [Baekduia sp.]|nr:class I SAM-dependent methyltransferase [Baekduia sp.]
MAEGPAGGTLPEGQVRAMFDRIAGVYDLMNSAMTAGLHHKWRKRAADLADVHPGDRVLDVATGTGDLAFELAPRVAPGGAVVGSDFSEEMLVRARRKLDSRRNASEGPVPLSNVHFEWADVLSLPYADNEFDAATVGFGARNYGDLEKGIAEMTRVIKPGGRVVILEITTPTKEPLATFYKAWFDRAVPIIGRFAGDSDAYEYLPNSVKRFPGPEGLGAAMARCGLKNIKWVLTAGGIIAIHVGEKADPQPRD